MTRHLYLSPHLDDAVLSCGGRIARDVREGAQVEILTVFAGDEPASHASAFVEQIYALWKLAPGEVMATRRAEDRAASDVLGAEPVWWDLREAIHRRDPASDRPLYPDLRALFGPIAAAEEPLVAALAERLRFHPGAEGADRIAAPLGVGGHADHRLLRAAAERAFEGQLVYYEEFPYVIWKLFALARARGPRRRWIAESQPLGETEIGARIAAIGCYASQIRPLFGDTDRLERMVRRHVRRARGERFWRPVQASRVGGDR